MWVSMSKEDLAEAVLLKFKIKRARAVSFAEQVTCMNIFTDGPRIETFTSTLPHKSIDLENF